MGTPYVCVQFAGFPSPFARHDRLCCMTLLHEIARCPVAELCLQNPSAKHPCREIVLFQSSSSLDEHQVPEPWSGHLEQAPILFLSSNPSISVAEEYPRWSWLDEAIEDYFSNRFGGGNKTWITQGKKSLQRDGTYSGSVAFWAAVQQRAIELVERDVVPGMDYALTEIVHCKSREERGVAEAQEHCVPRYLQRVLNLAGAKVVVVLGTRAKAAIQTMFSIPKDTNVFEPTRIGNHARLITFLPHPNAYTPKSFAKCLSPDDLQKLRSFLKG